MRTLRPTHLCSSPGAQPLQRHVGAKAPLAAVAVRQRRRQRVKTPTAVERHLPGFGVLIGTATSACGSLLWALLIATWFPGARRASAVGILQAATPASPLVLTPILFFAIAHDGWRAAAVCLGLVLLLLAFPLAYCIVKDLPATAGPAPEAPAAQQRGRMQDVRGLVRRGPLRNLMLAQPHRVAT